MSHSQRLWRVLAAANIQTIPTLARLMGSTAEGPNLHDDGPNAIPL